MNEVFGKTPVTSRDFPVLLFAANGTLMHFNPPLESFFLNQLFIAGHPKTPEEIEAAWIKSLSILKPEDFLQALLTELKISSDAQPALIKQIIANRESLKVVIADSTIQTCETLRERGYRLAIVSNGDHRIAEILRQHGVLELFEVVISADGRASHMKPEPAGIFEALEDLDVPADKALFIGDSFSKDIVGAQAAGLKSLLYDPTFRELKALALSTSEAHNKVVSIDALRQNRRLQGVKVATRFEDLLSFFL